MRSALALLVLAVLGLFGATSIGYAAYIVSRDSVGLPVTKAQALPEPARADSRQAPRLETQARAENDFGPHHATNDDR